MATSFRSAAPAAGAFIAVLLLGSFDPATTWWFPSCPLRALTGWLCPLCGSLRALHALLRGEPAVALAFNPLVTLAALAATAAVIVDALRPARAPSRALLARFAFSVPGLILFTVFGVARNLIP